MKTKSQALATIRQLSDQIIEHAKRYELEAAVVFMDQEDPQKTLVQNFHLSMFGNMVDLNLIMARFGMSDEKMGEVRSIVEAELQRHATLLPVDAAAQ